jgi:Glyoxalase-like domain
VSAPALTRRELLARAAAGAGLGLLGGRMTNAATLTPARDAVDHLLLGAADLDQGVAWLEGLTGVKAVAGGSHPGAGTRNALVSLGGRQYLEVIAPDPKQDAVSNARVDGLRRLAQPRLVTWAAAAKDIAATAARARQAGLEVSDPSDGSRARPDGKLLRWKALRVPSTVGADDVEPVPFFIEWAAGSLHPSQDSPTGCTLRSFEIEHPEPARVVQALEKLGIAAKVRPAKAARLLATLATPRGEVQLV